MSTSMIGSVMGLLVLKLYTLVPSEEPCEEGRGRGGEEQGRRGKGGTEEGGEEQEMGDKEKVAHLPC